MYRNSLYSPGVWGNNICPVQGVLISGCLSSLHTRDNSHKLYDSILVLYARELDKELLSFL